MSIVDDFWNWYDKIWGKQGAIQSANQTLPSFSAIESLEVYYNKLPPDVQEASTVKALYLQRKVELADVHAGIENPIAGWVEGLLDDWLARIKEYETADPAKAKENLSKLSADVIQIAAASAVVDYTMGVLPNGLGEASSNNTKQLLTWLGFGAVLTAVAHDPVKIGLLRPYQDSLEQTFRNRRPGDMELFQAYRTRELSPVKVDDLSKLDDAEMNRIEADNQKFYDAEIAKWGYSEWFANALARSATRTLGFTQLTTLARAGIFDRGLAIYSLWGEGLDRTVMPQALTALETMRDREMYSGFRSMIEPSYVEGDISEAELREYWGLAGVPVKVQDWVIVRLRKRREAALAKQKGQQAQKERDLTVSQVTQAFQAGLIKRTDANNMITALGYSQAESDILLNLAETRIKAQGGTQLKRLTLTDYEKAYEAKLISLDAVLQRMRGEYTPADIDLEKKLLEAGTA